MKRLTLTALPVLVAMLLVGLALLSATAERPDDLGPVDASLKGCPGPPNCVSTGAVEDRHRIEPLEVAGPPREAMERLRTVLEARPRTVIIEARAGYLHAEVTSLLFRFVDDLEFLLDREASAIQMRSASRVGYWDLGANRERLEAIRSAFRAAGGD